MAPLFFSPFCTSVIKINATASALTIHSRRPARVPRHRLMQGINGALAADVGQRVDVRRGCHPSVGDGAGGVGSEEYVRRRCRRAVGLRVAAGKQRVIASGVGRVGRVGGGGRQRLDVIARQRLKLARVRDAVMVAVHP